MKNIFKLIGVIALAAVIGFSMAACRGGGDDDDTDPALNGTWVIGNQVWKFNNGLFEVLIGGSNFQRGTYTTNNNIITIIITEIYGGYPLYATYGLSPTRWYFRKDLLQLGTTELDKIFITNTEPYYIDGTTFTWGTDIYTKDGGSTGPGPGTGTAPTITTASLPNGTVGTAYSQTLRATGDTPITWSRDSGALPNGLTLSAAGVISGTPTTTGASTFTVKAANAKGNDTKQLSITITGGSMSGWTAITNSTFADTTINVIAHGNNKFVAGGDAGKMAYSSDGVTWTAINTGTLFDYVYNEETRKASVKGIAYGNNKFIAGGTKGKMATSTDGITWTAVDISSIFNAGDDINAIAYGNNMFVATGDRTAYSSDGLTWTRSNNPFASWDWVNTIVYGNGKFVVGGASEDVAYSTDGVTWTKANSNIGGGFFEIKALGYGSNMFVVAGGNVSREKMATSPDGVTWTALANSIANDFGTFGHIYTIAYGNNKFVAVGNYGRMAYSPDGITWTKEDVTGIFGSGGNDSINAIVFVNGRFVVGGANGKMAYSTGN